MKVGVIGTGYVGLISGACFATFGHFVTCIDKNVDVIERLKRKQLPFFEPDLEALLNDETVRQNMSFGHDISGIKNADVVFIAVGTPETPQGDADVSAVFAAIEQLAPHLKSGARLILKSTVPIGTNRRAHNALERLGRKDVGVISNPEFLREGSAIVDFMNPDRIVIGMRHSDDAPPMRTLYAPLLERDVPFLIVSPETAETIKYAANSFLAMKITFINQIADLCEKTGAKVEDVASGIGLDHRINPYFLKPGPGFGGSCFPKDTRALCAVAKQHGVDLSLIRTAIEANEARKSVMAKRIQALCGGEITGKTIAVWGITFKANTDDLRESPALTILPHLEAMGATLKLFDPKATKDVEDIFDTLRVFDSPYDAALKADALVVLTEWDMFRHLDLARVRAQMTSPRLIDLRNLFDPEHMDALGFSYSAIGYTPRNTNRIEAA